MESNYYTQIYRDGRLDTQRGALLLEISRRVNRIIRRKKKQTFEFIKKSRKVPPRQQNSFRILQQQFIEHCAIIIQSRFRGFIQRKRYRQFLPIYRRFRQLILAITEGWKTRKVLKLNPIKNQINLIKEKQAKNQLSSLRIGKRELIDEIERFRKKGKWVQQYRKQRMFKKKVQVQDGKQNSSLFGNIKPISIKNVFKQQGLINNNKKIEKASKVSSKKVPPQDKTKIQRDAPKQASLQIKNTRNQFDQVAITPKQNFYSLLQQKLYEQKQVKPQQKTKISKYLKKPVKKLNSQQIRQVIDQAKKPKGQKGKLNNGSKSSDKIENKVEKLKLDNKSVNTNYNTLQSNRSKKIKLSLSKQSAETQSLSTHRRGNSQLNQISPFLSTNSNYSTRTLQNSKYSQNTEIFAQNISFEYRNNYLKRTMSIRKKSEQQQGQYRQNQEQMQRYSLLELSQGFSQ